MSSENEDQLSPRSLVGSSTPESDPNMPRIRYTRDFLLSLSGLDVCKNFPRGFDKSILSDLEEAANTTFERQRGVGSLSLQGSRRGDYGSQSLNRQEISNSYTRGCSGRWDSRSSGSSDREGDLQCDRESFSQDSGKRFGSQNRRNWQNSEHDGLLGSGAFARPSGYAGASAQKSRDNSQYQLNKSSEPYQPPKPNKSAPYPRKDNSDSCNDETFGSTECSSEDRAEEERKRRESFELMRKEQHKMPQGKPNKDIQKGNLDVDIMALLENSDIDKSAQNRGKPEESAAASLCESDSLKSSSHIHVSAARPLVPPGFSSALAEKKHEISKLKSTSMQSVDGKEKPCALPPVEADVGFGNASFITSDDPEVTKVWNENTPNDFFEKKDAGSHRIDVVTQDYSASILDKLFGSATANTSNSLANDIQNHVEEADDAWAHVPSSSSKFVHLFHEESEEKNPVEDKPSRDLLSLIINSDKIGSQLNDEATKQNQSTSTSENNVAAVLTSPVTSTFGGLPSESYQRDEQSLSHTVLTCEDLEQSILAEVKDNSSGMQSLLESWTAVDGKSEEHKDVVDDHASQHLLSLLQRGANSKESLSSPMQDVLGSLEMLAASDVESSLCLQVAENAATISETDHSSEKHITLEALFGIAFMNELHSMEAPISSQRASVGSVQDSGATQSHGLPFYPDADSLTYASIDQNSKANLEGEMPQLTNATEHKRAHHNAENWAGYRDSPLYALKPSDLAFEEASGDIQLPEEDSLISLNYSLGPMALHCQKENRNESHVTIGDINDTLVHAILRDGGSRKPGLDCPPLMHSSHEMVDPDSIYHHLQGRSASQFPHQVNHARPLFTAHLDHPTFRNPQMNFVSPDAMHHDPHHLFARNIYPHHSYNRINSPHFDPASHHPMPLPMQVPGNFPPPHSSMHGLPRQPLSHPINHMSASSHEMSNPNAFSMNHHRQPNNGGLGLGMPGTVGTAAGRPPTEILERLIELEMRANQKQFHPAMARHVSGVYGTEVDMNLRYR